MKLFANTTNTQQMTVLQSDKVHEQEPQHKQPHFTQPYSYVAVAWLIPHYLPLLMFGMIV